MKISRLSLTNFLKHRDLALSFSKPVAVIHGPNGIGKSSIAEAIELALTADNPRVPLKKDYGTLVYDGAKAGAVELDVDDDHYKLSIAATGAVQDNHKGLDVPTALPYVLRPWLFASATPEARKDFLFTLLKLDLSQEAKKERLLAKGCNEAKLDAIMPILRAGFPKAEKRANEEASESRGAWKAVTGENYGAVKAETWRAPPVAFSAEQAVELHGLDKSIAAAETELSDAHKRLGEAEYAQRQAQQRAEQIAQLQGIAAKLDEHTKLAAKADGELKELKDELRDVREKAGMAPLTKPPLLPCPDCGAALCLQLDGTLAIYPTLPADPPHDPDAAASIPSIEKAIGTMRAVVARHTKNRDDAKTAADHLKLLDQQPPAKTNDPEPIRQTIETLKTSVATMKKRQAELQTAQRALDEADTKTKTARKHHADVQDWLKIAAALSPGGIPGELLAEAIGPLNDRLAQSIADAAWYPDGKDVASVLAVGPDMGITLNGRDYRFRSRAEKYLIDAFIAEAISHFSGLRFLLCDDADVLVGESWHAFIRWADVLGNYGEADTVLIFVASESTPPVKDTQDSIEIHAIEASTVDAQREAA